MIMHGVALYLLSLAVFLGQAADGQPGVRGIAAVSGAAPTPDPLAVPVLPESPTQVDIGRNLYYYHCMPCHGDQGQGLTDDWREVWDEDHRNCWARGCHSGRAGEEGFAIPRSVPPVSGSSQAIARFVSAEPLFQYLHQEHPPQRPGALSEDECWALTAFLLCENGRLPADGEVGPQARGYPWLKAAAAGAVLLIFLVLVSYAVWRKKHPGQGTLPGACGPT